MMVSNREWKLMISRFAGSISPENDALLSSWIDQSDQHLKIYEKALKIWQNSTAKSHHGDPSTEQEWLKLKHRIEHDENKVIKFNPSFRLKIAASLVLIALAGVYILQRNRSDRADTPTSVSSTGEVVTLYLPDSSKVWLNTNSRISYQKDFGHHFRSVELQGEAYFEVRHDTTPFLVSTSKVNVQVLGTSFNVKDNDTTAVITVAKGIVRLTSPSASNKVELTAGEVGIVEGESIKERRNADLQFASWRKRNNPVYTREAENPTHYLANKNNWKKNQLNLSVIEGTIVNTATLAAYNNIVLKVTYIRPSGKPVIVRTIITDTIYPEQKLAYRKTLLDIFTKTQKLNVEIEKAEVNPL
jgi:ferric-dicitrate binding protein FerR (iron transport regulator)